MGQLIITALLNASASISLKKSNSYSDPARHFGLLAAGLLIYGVSFIFYSYVLRKYDASIAYTFITGLTIVFLSIASYALLGESFSIGKIIGIVLVFAGICCLVFYS